MAASIYTHRGRRVATLFEIIFRAAPGLAQRLADGGMPATFRSAPDGLTETSLRNVERGRCRSNV